MPRHKQGDDTRKRILSAAAQEFVESGFDGVSISQVAQRAKVSKQLVHHHFSSKEELFATVHESLFRPSTVWDERLPSKVTDLIADRFLKRAKNIKYMRVLTWEAASKRTGTLPGESERQQRLMRHAMGLKLLQAQGKLPDDMDPELIQLTILALASYPLSFTQITRLTTGHFGTDPVFQRRWAKHLRKVAQKLFAVK